MDPRIKEHMPIDRGWAWVICLATFGLFSFEVGLYKSQGVILVELQERFPETSGTSLLWMFSLSNLVNSCSGLLAGFLLSKLTHRTVAIVGVLLSSAATIAVGYSPSVDYMYALFVIVGFSTSLLYVTAVTAYTNYFDKRKALALGIAASGAGIGGICIPPFLRVLFDNLDFSSAILLFAGLTLQLLIFACLLRPISHYEELAHQKCIKQDQIIVHKLTLAETDNVGKAAAEVGSLKTARRHSDTTSNLKSVADEKLLKSAPNLLPVNDVNHTDSTPVLFYSASNIVGSKLIEQNTAKSQTNKNFNWRIALKRESILMGFGSLFFMAGISVVFQCIPLLGKSSGVSKDTVALLLAMSGGIEIPCRILNGVLADRKLISAIAQLALCMGVTGLAAFLCSIISGLAGITILLLTYGIFGSSVFSLIPIASGELLGQENVTTALGINLFYQSLAVIMSVFSSGTIFDGVGKWEYVFYFIGGTMITGGAVNGYIVLSSYFSCGLKNVNLLLE